MSQSEPLELEWPPPYTLKKHARARHVKLKASIRHGIEIVVPPRFNVKHLPEILEKNKTWLLKRLAEINAIQKSEPENALPSEIRLLALNQTWKVVYLITAHKKVKLMTRVAEKELVLLGNCKDQTLCRELLIRWIKNQAKLFLTDYLTQLSHQTQLTFKGVTIRDQQTRWGSCTSSKAISLNYKLIFLPLPLVRHILIHELAHTVHLNHSEKFWQLVASKDVEWENHRTVARRIQSELPRWLEQMS